MYYKLTKNALNAQCINKILDQTVVQPIRGTRELRIISLSRLVVLPTRAYVNTLTMTLTNFVLRMSIAIHKHSLISVR